MLSSEDLARFVAANSANLVEQENKKGRNSMVPKPPAPGEYMICQQCGKVMYPEDFSEDPKIRKHEFKWQIHYKCEQEIWNLVDRQTPGLLAERKNGVLSQGKPVRLGSNVRNKR